jgi:hypothetical protein
MYKRMNIDTLTQHVNQNSLIAVMTIYKNVSFEMIAKGVNKIFALHLISVSDKTDIKSHV